MPIWQPIRKIKAKLLLENSQELIAKESKYRLALDLLALLLENSVTS